MLLFNSVNMIQIKAIASTSTSQMSSDCIPSEPVMAYDNGEVRQEFSICFPARPVGGELRTSDESREVFWAERNELPALDIHPSIRLRIEHGYADRARLY